MNALALLLLAACSGSPQPASPASPPAPARADAMETFQATLRVHAGDPPGIWLDPDNGSALLVADGTPSCLTPFDGLRVAVTGTRAKAGDTVRFHLATLVLADDADLSRARLHAVGREQRLSGIVETRAGAAGSKMEGSTWDVFVASDGKEWQVWGKPPDLPHGKPLTVDVRPVQVSPFAAHMPGPTLWIRGVADRAAR